MMGKGHIVTNFFTPFLLLLVLDFSGSSVHWWLALFITSVCSVLDAIVALRTKATVEIGQCHKTSKNIRVAQNIKLPSCL